MRSDQAGDDFLGGVVLVVVCWLIAVFTHQWLMLAIFTPILALVLLLLFDRVHRT